MLLTREVQQTSNGGARKKPNKDREHQIPPTEGSDLAMHKYTKITALKEVDFSYIVELICQSSVADISAVMKFAEERVVSVSDEVSSVSNNSHPETRPPHEARACYKGLYQLHSASVMGGKC